MDAKLLNLHMTNLSKDSMEQNILFVWATQDVEYPYKLIKSMSISDLILQKNQIQKNAIWFSTKIPDDICDELKSELQQFSKLYIHTAAYDDAQEMAILQTVFCCDKLVQFSIWE